MGWGWMEWGEEGRGEVRGKMKKETTMKERMRALRAINDMRFPTLQHERDAPLHYGLDQPRIPMG